MTSLRGATTGTASSSTSLSVAKVSGTAAGDLILIFAAAVSVTLSAAAGFSDGGNTVSGNVNGRAYVRIADGTEGSSFGITLSGGATVGGAICAVYESPASIDPSAIPAVYVHSSGSGSIAVPGITLANSTGWLAWFGSGLGTGTTSNTITAPSGYTSQATIASFSNGSDTMTMMLADLEAAQAAGATGTVTGTQSFGAHQAGWLVGISPAASAGGVNPGGFLQFLA